MVGIDNQSLSILGKKCKYILPTMIGMEWNLLLIEIAFYIMDVEMLYYCLVVF